MTLLDIIMIGLSLSMDAFSVSVSNGVCLRKLTPKYLFLIAGMFGLFQGLMPIIGFLAGAAFASFVMNFSKYIVFGVLFAIGVKMILDSKKEAEEQTNCPLIGPKLILIQAIATSMDALAVGISFSTMNVGILPVSALIALITFVVCLFGVFVGHRFGSIFRRQAIILGGVVLILIGIKILLGV